jgi:tetratricopeptide (TPR) repeat protein
MLKYSSRHGYFTVSIKDQFISGNISQTLYLTPSTNLITMRNLLFLTTIIFFSSCSKPKEQTTVVEAVPEPETYSFAGKPLYAKPADSLTSIKSDSIIASIKTKSELTEEDYIEISRQLLTVNQFKKAVENFTEGLEKHPNSFKLLRHRGHRYLNLRQLDKAIADLNKSEELIRNQSETWEYDANGKPTATYQHQIWYHIGLYHYLKRDYTESAKAYEKSLAYTKEGNNIAGASDWLYNAYERSGQKDKIPGLLKKFTLDFNIENKDYPYFRRLLLFNRVIKPEDLADENKPIDQMSLLETTKLYGLANWYAYNGNTEKANLLYNKVLMSKEWQGFAYACAELDAK